MHAGGKSGPAGPGSLPTQRRRSSIVLPAKRVATLRWARPLGRAGAPGLILAPSPGRVEFPSDSSPRAVIPRWREHLGKGSLRPPYPGGRPLRRARRAQLAIVSVFPGTLSGSLPSRPVARRCPPGASGRDRVARAFKLGATGRFKSLNWGHQAAGNIRNFAWARTWNPYPIRLRHTPSP